MANVNKVILIGNLTRDPEVKFTPKGSAVCELSLAINRNYVLDSGEKREETTYVDVTVWGKKGEVIGEYFKKGSQIYLEGRLQLDTWDDKQSGQKRSKLRVIGESFEFLDRKSSSDNSGGGEYRSSSRPPSRPAPAPSSAAPIDEGDDIPF